MRWNLISKISSLIWSGSGWPGELHPVTNYELSLHLNWQERFVDDIRNLKTGAQFIFATHSPEIIAGYEDKCIEVSN